jgi:hypothetical protein
MKKIFGTPNILFDFGMGRYFAIEIQLARNNMDRLFALEPFETKFL